MNLVKKMEHWGDTHHTHWLSIVRIGLGILLLAKGISFVMDNHVIADRIARANFELSFVSLVHYVIFAHVLGGIMMILGFQTRFAAILQIPILVGAVFFVNMTMGYSYLNSELWLSIVVLILLMVFVVVGSGRYSLDNMMNKPGYKREI